MPQLDLLFFGATGNSGYATLPFTVPAFAGIELSLQTGMFDSSGALGIALTNAVVARLGL